MNHLKTPLLLAVLATTALAGCLGDDGTDGDDPEPTPTGGTSERTVESATSLEHVARLLVEGADTEDGADDVPYPSGSGIWVHDGYAYGSALGAGFFVADVRDPHRPVLLYDAPDDSETAFSRDADLVLHDDGRKTLVLATQNNGMHIYDVTDPARPQLLSRTLEDVANHNVAVVPGTPYVFNSRSGGAGSTNDLVDLTDPAAPQVVGTYGTHGCHDISFFGAPGAERFRAYCAGIERTEIWDLDGFDMGASGFGIALLGTVEGAASPVVGNPAFGVYPLRTLHHLAMVNHDATVLIVGDEHNGGGSPGTCFLSDSTTGLSTPLGALWFYDISDETAPELLSWFSPPTVTPVPERVLGGGDTGTPNCTAHFGTLVAGEEKLVMAWYSAGVVLLDFSDPSSPRMLDQFQPEGINTWDARVVGDYVFTGDITRGMDVLKLG